MLNRPDLGPDHPINKIPQHLMQLGDSKFAAKLSFHERCQMLALRMAGMSIGAVAVTFKVNRRTVTHVYNTESPRYQNVRALRDNMGEAAFLSKFLTEDVVERVKAFASTPEGQESWKDDEKNPGSAKAGIPNKLATGSAGISMHKADHHAFSHRIQIEWVPDVDPPGWYCKLLDVEGVDKDNWNGDPDAQSHLTSSKALAWAKHYLTENY